MRLAATSPLALCVTLPTTIAANASDGVVYVHKHRIYVHRTVQRPARPGRCRSGSLQLRGRLRPQLSTNASTASPGWRVAGAKAHAGRMDSAAA